VGGEGYCRVGLEGFFANGFNCDVAIRQSRSGDDNADLFLTAGVGSAAGSITIDKKKLEGGQDEEILPSYGEVLPQLLGTSNDWQHLEEAAQGQNRQPIIPSLDIHTPQFQTYSSTRHVKLILGVLLLILKAFSSNLRRSFVPCECVV